MDSPIFFSTRYFTRRGPINNKVHNKIYQRHNDRIRRPQHYYALPEIMRHGERKISDLNRTRETGRETCHEVQLRKLHEALGTDNLRRANNRNDSLLTNPFRFTMGATFRNAPRSRATRATAIRNYARIAC